MKKETDKRGLSYEEVEKRVLKVDFTDDILELLIYLSYINYGISTPASLKFPGTFLRKNDYIDSNCILYPHTTELIRKWNPLKIPFTHKSLKWLYYYLKKPSRMHKVRLIKLGILNEFGDITDHAKRFLVENKIEDILKRTNIPKKNSRRSVYNYNLVRDLIVDVEKSVIVKAEKETIKNCNEKFWFPPVGKVEEITIYKTSDGKTFDKKDDAIKRETILEILTTAQLEISNTNIIFLEKLLASYTISRKYEMRFLPPKKGK